MPGSSNQSLVNAAKLISRNFTDNERQFAANLAVDLDKRIIERREIARGGKANVGINSKVKKTIKTSAEILGGLVGGGIGIAVGIASAGPMGGVVIGALSGTLGANLGKATQNAVLLRAENKAKGNAKIYQRYFPSDNNGTIKLFVQLVAHSMADKLNVTPSSLEGPATLQSIKKMADNTVRVMAAKRKISRQEEKQEIKKLTEKEFETIWDIFKDFTRNKQEYNDFKETPSAKKIADLFVNHCDLGDAADRSEIVSDYEINYFWINLFSRYLEEKNPGVHESVLASLESKWGVIAEVPSDVDEERPRTFERDQSSASLSSQASSSSGISSSESFASPARKFYSSPFFALPAAVFPANQPEAEENLSPRTRL